MKTKLVRLLALCALLTAAFYVVGVAPASADYYAGYKWPGSSGPPDCLFSGAGIITTQSPNRHNAAAANSCHSTFNVKILLYENNSSGGRIITCDTTFEFNFRECSIQNATGSGDYWVWRASIIASDGITYTSTCSNQGFPYQDCFDSSD